jgi:hypothetical protein
VLCLIIDRWIDRSVNNNLMFNFYRNIMLWCTLFIPCN